MPELISVPTPGHREATGFERDHKFGYFETQHARGTQEDALAWHSLTTDELTATGSARPLTPIEIGHRLWTSYQKLNKPELISGDDGSTATTTVYDGRGNFITATLADAVTFAAVYNKEGKVLGVTRLNSVTHKPTNPDEFERIKAAGGFVIYDRVQGELAVSRAIGDKGFGHLVPADASIDISNVGKIAAYLEIHPADIGSIQIISTCDGFTDGAKNQTKTGHEAYLDAALKAMTMPGTMPEEELAKKLTEVAIVGGSRDNISIAVQTITPTTSASLLGVYDGHGGAAASTLMANNIGPVFKKLCKLTPEAYAEEEFSVNKHKEIYDRDNHAVELGVVEIITSPAPAEQKTAEKPRPLEREGVSDALRALNFKLLSNTQEEFNYLFATNQTITIDNNIMMNRRLNRAGVIGTLFKDQTEFNAWQQKLISLKNEQAKKQELSDGPIPSAVVTEPRLPTADTPIPPVDLKATVVAKKEASVVVKVEPETLEPLRRKCQVLLEEVSNKLRSGTKDPKMDEYVKTNSEKIKMATSIELEAIKQKLTEMSKNNAQVERIKDTIKDFREGAAFWKLAVGKNKKADAIEKALLNVDIENRGTAFEDPKVREELAKHRHWGKQGTVYKKEDKLDEENAANSFKELKRIFSKESKTSVDDEDSSPGSQP